MGLSIQYALPQEWLLYWQPVAVPECPGVAAGTTECAPEPVPGCGRRLHPPAVIWWPSQGFSWQVEPGADPMGWPIPAQALATDTPLDGGCAELPSDRAWVWMAP